MNQLIIDFTRRCCCSGPSLNLSSSATKPIAFRLRCRSSTRLGRKINKTKTRGEGFSYFILFQGRKKGPSHPRFWPTVVGWRYHTNIIVLRSLLAVCGCRHRPHKPGFITKEKYLRSTNQFEKPPEITLGHSAFSSAKFEETYHQRVLQLETSA